MTVDLKQMSTKLFLFLLVHFIFVHLIPYASASEVCYTRSSSQLTCEYGCCGSYDSVYCCPSTPVLIGPIIGSLVSSGVIIILICLGICACRRRRARPAIIFHNAGTSQAVVYHQNPMISTQNGTLNTEVLPPGISYGAYPNSQADGSMPPPSYYTLPPSYSNLPPPPYSAGLYTSKTQKLEAAV